MSPYQQIARNDAIFYRLYEELPSLRFQLTIFICLFLTIVPVEIIAVYLTYKMSFEGQDKFLIGGLALQAVASIGALHVIKKLGSQTINLWISRLAGLAFFCFIIGFGFIAATTSLKEVLINLIPEIGSSGIGLDGAEQHSTSQTIKADAFNWLIPYAWYGAFTGLTLVLAFAAAEVLDRIMILHAKISGNVRKYKNWKKQRKHLEEAQDKIDRLDAAKNRWDNDIENIIKGHMEQIRTAFDDGLSEGPRTFLQNIYPQSPHIDPKQNVLVPVDNYRTKEVNIPQLEADLKKAESSCELQITSEIEHKGENK